MWKNTYPRRKGWYSGAMHLMTRGRIPRVSSVWLTVLVGRFHWISCLHYPRIWSGWWRVWRCRLANRGIITVILISLSRVAGLGYSPRVSVGTLTMDIWLLSRCHRWSGLGWVGWSTTGDVRATLLRVSRLVTIVLVVWLGRMGRVCLGRWVSRIWRLLWLLWTWGWVCYWWLGSDRRGVIVCWWPVRHW